MRARHSTDELLVLASDGVWDVVPNSHVLELAAGLRAGTTDVRSACVGLVDRALAAGSRDNITAMLVVLK